MHIVIGYDSPKGYDKPQMLYCGEDRGEALTVLREGPGGVARTEIFSHPRPAQRKFFEQVIEESKPPRKKVAAKKSAKKKPTK